MENEDKKAIEAYVVNHDVVTGESLLKMNVKELPYLVQGLFPQVGLALIAGSSDTGKSTILRQLAIAIALGYKDFLGFQLNLKHQKALYVSTEDDSIATAYLLKKNLPDLDPSKLSNLSYIFNSEGLLKKLEEQLSKAPVDLIIVDAFADVFDGEINSSSSVRPFLNKFSILAEKYKCLVLFLHHTGKRTENLAPSKSNIIGSQGIEAKMRLAIEFRKDHDNKDLRHLCIVKGNYISDNEKGSSIVLKLEPNLTYSNSGERKSFSELARQGYAQSVNSIDKLEEVCKCLEKKLSTREASEYLESRGIKIGKSTIGELYKRCPNVQSLSVLDNGQSVKALETEVEKVQAKGGDKEE